MFLTKLLAGTTVASLALSGVLYLMLGKAVAEKEAAQVIAKSAESAVEQVKNLFEQQKQEFDLIRNSIEAQQETFNDYASKIGSLERELGEARLEINQLRSSALNEAIAAPYDRGNDAARRLNNSVQRIRGN